MSQAASETAPGDRACAAPPLDDKPRSVYEIITRQMLEGLEADVAEIKGRVNTLLWFVAGATLLDLLMRVIK